MTTLRERVARAMASVNEEPEWDVTNLFSAYLDEADAAIDIVLEEAAAHLWDDMIEIERKHLRRSDKKQMEIRKRCAAEIRALKTG